MLVGATGGSEFGGGIVTRLGRRDFLALLVAGTSFRAGPVKAADDSPAQFLSHGPCADLRPLVDPANDVFQGEKRGMEIERILSSLIEDGGLPLAADMPGVSPMPQRYVEDGRVLRAVFGNGAEGFPKGMSRWIASLGEVRRAEFHALPNDIVRFEVASETRNGLEYRTGRWRMTWDGAYLSGFEPLSEGIARSPAPLFADATAELFGALPQFRGQLAKGVPYWRSRLDSATGIGVYGNQGVAVGDIDGDGWDELYACQPGGLPNRLYSRQEDGTWHDVTSEAGVGILDDTSQALFLDLRNIGFQDLVILTTGRPLLFLNDGTG